MFFIRGITFGSRKWKFGFFLVILLLANRCSMFQRGNTEYKPFVMYKLTVGDSDLKIVEVDGELHGALGSEVTLVQFTGMETNNISPIQFSATDFEGKSLRVAREGSGFIVKNGSRDFRFSYRVSLLIDDMYSPDIRKMLTMIDREHCRILAREVLLVPETEISDGIIIDLCIPRGWRLVSTSPSVNRKAIVDDVAELRDASIVCGDYKYEKATIDDTELSIVTFGVWRFDIEDFYDAVKRIVSYEIYLFGDSPRRRYIVVCEKNPVKYGRGFDYYGVHVGGAIFLFLDPRMDKGSLFDTPMSIVSHEFFHSWNGDALKPESDDFLWFVEGATVYYSYKVLLNTRIITKEQFEKRRSAILSRFINNPYYARIPIRNSANNDLSDKDLVNFLYDGGYIVCEALDIILSKRTGGKYSLIDVIKYMYNTRGKYEYINREKLLEAIREVTGEDFSNDLQRLIDGKGVQFSSALPYSLD